MMFPVPQEEEGPIAYAEDESDFEIVVECGFEEVAMVDEVDDWLRDKEDEGEDDCEIKKSSELGCVEGGLWTYWVEEGDGGGKKKGFRG